MTTPDAPDSGISSPESGAVKSAEMPPVSIAEMIERHVALTWPEAIALVAEACRLVVEAAPTATQVPEPARLLVFADGSLRIGPWRGEMDLSTTARTLHDLLAGAQPPTPLRLFVGHAVSSDKFATVNEFGEALAYYERPGRNELIQSAFQRFLLTPPDLPAPKPSPMPEAVQTPEIEKGRSRSTKTVGRLIAASVFLFVFAGGVTLALRIVSARQGAGSAPTLQSVSAQATSEFAGLKDKLRELGLPIAVDAAPAAAEVPTPETKEAPPRSSTSQRTGGRLASAIAVPIPNTSLRAIAPGPSPAEVSGQAPVPQQAATQPTPVEEAEDVNVYTNQSAGVSPPVVVDARVLPPNLSVSGAQTQNRLELVIGTDGRVEQVRMISPLERLPDMMLLSGAKTWMFRPAMKDGRPVRYRLPVTWTVSAR